LSDEHHLRQHVHAQNNLSYDLSQQAHNTIMSRDSVSRVLAYGVSLLQRPPAPLLALAITLHKLVGLEGVERRDTEEIARIAKFLYSTADWTILFGALTQGGTRDCITPKTLQDRPPCRNYGRKQDALYFIAEAVATLGKEGYIKAAKDMEQVGVAVFRWRNLQEAMELLELSRPVSYVAPDSGRRARD